MSEDLPEDITQLLEKIRLGNADAQNEVVGQIYTELRRSALRLMGRERAGHTLGATGLVHEALVQMVRGDLFRQAQNRQHLFGIAARLMRQILVAHARTRNAQKRDGRWQRMPLDDVVDSLAAQQLDILDLQEALEKLESLHPRQGQVVTLRFFGGFTVAETAQLLEVSLGTVENDFRIARAWLARQLSRNEP